MYLKHAIWRANVYPGSSEKPFRFFSFFAATSSIFGQNALYDPQKVWFFSFLVSRWKFTVSGMWYQSSHGVLKSPLICSSYNGGGFTVYRAWKQALRRSSAWNISLWCKLRWFPETSYWKPEPSYVGMLYWLVCCITNTLGLSAAFVCLFVQSTN